MDVRLLSWNIWCDGHFEEIKRFLESSQADIVCLQEVMPHSSLVPVIALMTSLGYAHVYGAALSMSIASGETQELGNAVFSKYPIVGSAIHALSDEHKRVAVQADINVAGTTLHVFSVHLKHTHHQPSALQELQGKNLRAVLPAENTIVMGDFNATPESAVIVGMRSMLTDTDPTSTPTWSMYPEGCSTCKPQGVDTRLDYIFVSRNMDVSAVKVEHSNGSDHLPVSAILTI